MDIGLAIPLLILALFITLVMFTTASSDYDDYDDF